MPLTWPPALIQGFEAPLQHLEHREECAPAPASTLTEGALANYTHNVALVGDQVVDHKADEAVLPPNSNLLRELDTIDVKRNRRRKLTPNRMCTMHWLPIAVLQRAQEPRPNVRLSCNLFIQ